METLRFRVRFPAHLADTSIIAETEYSKSYSPQIRFSAFFAARTRCLLQPARRDRHPDRYKAGSCGRLSIVGISILIPPR